MILNLSTREKIILFVVVASIGYLVFDFFIKKAPIGSVKAAQNLAVLNNLINQTIKDNDAQGVTRFDTYVITRAQSDWVRDPFPEDSFFSKPLMTLQEKAEEVAEERKRVALLREKNEEEAAAVREKEALLRAKKEEEAAEARKREALLEAKKKEAVQARAKKLRYSGFIYMDNYPIVIVKGMEYLVGDEVDGFIIKKIDPEMVTLQDKDNGDVITLNFDEEIIPQR